jgi:hypothetical protein
MAAELQVKPLYSDPRFPPTDKLHAGCMQNADITLATELDIKEIRVTLQFDPQKIDILRILPDNKNRDEVVDYDIKYGEISYTHKNMVYNPWYEIKVFSMMFNSKKDINNVDFVFGSGSYAVTQWGQRVNLEGQVAIPFADVPECDPDIIPPSVTMIRPVPSEVGIALDSLFVFEIKDIGKWYDPESIYILIGQDAYTINTPGVAFSGEYLVVQPRTWLPVWAEIEVKVAVSDLQVFGWANRTEKTFLITTAASVLLDDNINPMELKQRSRELRQSQWSSEECRLLQSLQWFIAEDSRRMIEDVAAKIECDLVLAVDSQFGSPDQIHSAAWVFLEPEKSGLSLFAITGWILFFVTLLLKLHYFVSYKEHKKLLTEKSIKSL